MLREVQRDPLLILILSVYLLLLAFFILLNNISKVELVRAKAVTGSLESAFASYGRPTRTPAVFTSAAGTALGDDTLEVRLGALVKAELRLTEVEVITPGRLMQLRIHERALFSGPDNEISSAGRRFVRRLAAALRTPSHGVRYEVEVRIGGGAAGRNGLDDGNMERIQKAAALAQALAGAKAPSGTVAGGVEYAPPGEVRFLFYARPETAPPLFDDVVGG